MHVKLAKLLKTMMNFKRLLGALVMLYLLVTPYIGAIKIECQGWEFSSTLDMTMTKWCNKYIGRNCKKNGTDEVNNGGHHHTVEDTEEVGVESGKYIPPVLTVPRTRDKEVAHEEQTEKGAPNLDSNIGAMFCLTLGELTKTWTCRNVQWMVTKDRTADCFDVEAATNDVATESNIVIQKNTRLDVDGWHSKYKHHHMWDTWSERYTRPEEGSGNWKTQKGKGHPLRHSTNKFLLTRTISEDLSQPTPWNIKWLLTGELLAKFSTHLDIRQMREKAQGYLISTWTSKIGQWTVTKDGNAGSFEIEAANSHVAAELFLTGIWPMWDVWQCQERGSFEGRKGRIETAPQRPRAKGRRPSVIKTATGGTGGRQRDGRDKGGNRLNKGDHQQAQGRTETGLSAYRVRESLRTHKRSQEICGSYRSPVPPYPPPPHASAPQVLKEARYRSRNSYRSLVPLYPKTPHVPPLPLLNLTKARYLSNYLTRPSTGNAATTITLHLRRKRFLSMVFVSPLKNDGINPPPGSKGEDPEDKSPGTVKPPKKKKISWGITRQIRISRCCR